jgi:hypothetical protein
MSYANINVAMQLLIFCIAAFENGIIMLSKITLKIDFSSQNQWFVRG